MYQMTRRVSKTANAFQTMLDTTLFPPSGLIISVQYSENQITKNPHKSGVAVGLCTAGRKRRVKSATPTTASASP
jgi:hypothetical protein